jgi:hypothetical protein
MGSGAKALQTIARHILGQVCSASACERNDDDDDSDGEDPDGEDIDRVL